MLAFIQSKSQSLIDLSKDEVKLVIKQEHKKMSQDKFIADTMHSEYVLRAGRIWLYFLS